MLLVDVNVLIHAVDSTSRRHERARDWLVRAMEDPSQTVAMPWTVLLGFVRITTNPRVFPNPLSADEAMEYVEGWLQRPQVLAIEPTAKHVHLLKGLLAEAGTAGNLTTDAHLAALCLEYGATMVSFDGDMSRFGIACVRPS